MPNEEKYEESTLLSLLSQDSEYAFQLIFDRYRNHIYKASILYVKSPVIAEEIVQDVFLKLWFQRHQLIDIRSLESWLFILARNLAFNSLKKIAYEWNAREKWMDAHADLAIPADDKLISDEYRKLVHEAIAHLSPQQREVYLLAKEQGLSYEAIATKLVISPLTVKTHMSRAMASIREFLLQHGAFVLLLPILFADGKLW